MSRGTKRLAARRDANEREVRRELARVGAHVFQIDTPADLLVRFRRQWFVLEVKTKRGRLTPDQVQARAAMAASGDPIPVVRSGHDALVAIGAVR